MMREHRILVVMAMLGWACGSGGAVQKDVEADVPGDEVARVVDVVLLPDAQGGGDTTEPDISWPELRAESLEPGGKPGEGCFLDECTENSQCDSGWCIDHMGEGVCSQACTEECPAGWVCKQVAGTDPDLVYVCVSDHANLCKPCATHADCKSVGGQDDVCLAYGGEGSFCGSGCDPADPKGTGCPWGFSCEEAVTVDGVGTFQCVAETGSCPCTAKSVERSLWTPCAVENEFGSCVGKRFCTVDGLSDCDASVPAAEGCNGLDDDCDGEADEPALVDGKYIELCDDGNPCTIDACLGAAGCSQEAVHGGECADGDPCTVADHCEQGVCVGQQVDCDDDNPCTVDSCDAAGGCVHDDANAECDDGDACTLGDHCVAGECVGTEVECDCLQDADCAALEDGNLCNGTLFCNTDKVPFLCQVEPGTEVTCPEPPAGPDAICLQPACLPETGACTFLPDHEGFPCDDGDACTAGDHCVEGACAPGTEVLCGDGNACTDDSCTPETGCLHVDNDAACDDGNECTLGDHCAGGLCVADSLLACDDGDPCTNDSCKPGNGCVHTLNSAPCDDGDLCTTGDHCHLGECIGAGSLPCNDNNPCTDDSCQAQTGCAFVANTAACDDGNACTLGDQCANGWCLSSSLVDCDDSNPCTDDSCSPATGCSFVDNDVACDDGSACTLGDHCVNGSCQAGTEPLLCDDSNPCTDDSCDPATGCFFVDNDVACDDGSACTLGDQCVEGACQAGTEVLDCDDSNLCTDDSCDPATGCFFVDNDVACDDGDACTLGDHCGEGSCQAGTEVLSCDDSNPCTSDGCAAAAGCTHANLQDGTACGQPGWTCKAGVCTPPQQNVKRVFVTSIGHNGNFGGIAGADSFCQQRANAAGLNGTFKAWLSAATVGTSPSARFVKANVPYALVDGTVIASNWADLTDGAINVPLNLTEFGTVPTTGTLIWSYTRIDGTPGLFGDPNHKCYGSDCHCKGWTTTETQGSPTQGSAFALRNKSNDDWTDYSFANACSGDYSLYCFEQ
jgi:hypothetical protein